MGCSAELFLDRIWLRLYSVHVQYFEKTWCSCKNACQSSCNVQYTIARAKPIISDSKVLYSALAPIVKGAEIIWFYRVCPPCCPYAGWHILCRTLLRFSLVYVLFCLCHSCKGSLELFILDRLCTDWDNCLHSVPKSCLLLEVPFSRTSVHSNEAASSNLLWIN